MKAYSIAAEMFSATTHWIC